MLYAIFCYDSEEAVEAWTPEEDEAAIAKLLAVQDELRAEGRLGPVARLGGTAKAKTVRKAASLRVLDGPFAEAKEALLGFYVVSCETEADALDAATRLARASSSEGAFEVRPLRYFDAGALASGA